MLNNNPWARLLSFVPRITQATTRTDSASSHVECASSGCRVIRYSAIALLCAAFFLFNADAMWTWSVDLAHHYALTFRIYETWTMATSADPALGEMNYYPRGSHTLAAIIGGVVGSPFMGVQIVVLLAIVVLWLSITSLLGSLRSHIAIGSLAAFTALLTLNALLKWLPIHGEEVSGNFFFAQIVGFAALYAAMHASVRIEKLLGAIGVCVFLIVVMIFIATVHLLPALILLVAICGSLLVYVMFPEDFKNTMRQRLRIAIPLASFAVASLALHPSTSAMRAIADHEGQLSFSGIDYPHGTILLGISTLIVSILLMLEWLRDEARSKNVALKYIAILGGSAAGLFSLQLLLSSIGIGSDYAAKKHVFALSTVFLVQVSVFAGIALEKLFMNSSWLAIVNHRIFSAIWLPSAFGVAVLISTQNEKVLDVSAVVARERALVTVRDALLPAPDASKSNVVIGLDEFPNVGNYMFSIAIAGTSRENAISDVLERGGIEDFSRYSYVLSAHGDPASGSAGCQSLSNGPVSIVAATCLEQRRNAATDCSSGFDFATSGYIPRSMLTGFSHPEVTGRWTEGRFARFQCRVTGAPSRSVTIQLAPFLFGPTESQRIMISLNGKNLGGFDLRSARGADNPIVLDIPDSLHASAYTIEFAMPDAISPVAVGLNEDARVLGFLVKRIDFR